MLNESILVYLIQENVISKHAIERGESESSLRDKISSLTSLLLCEHFWYIGIMCSHLSYATYFELFQQNTKDNTAAQASLLLQNSGRTQHDQHH